MHRSMKKKMKRVTSNLSMRTSNLSLKKNKKRGIWMTEFLIHLPVSSFVE